MLSTSPPTACGIATFTTALGRALLVRGEDVSIVRVLQGDDNAATSPLTEVATLRADDASSMARASWALNRCDVARVQHEFGLYGGVDGDDVVQVLEALRVPVVTILHTVLSTPSTHQREVLNDVIRLSTCVIVMTGAADATLRRGYDVVDTLVRVIPHGASLGTVPLTPAPGERPVLLTWGLLGPGKGIELVIDALAHLTDLSPRPSYLVAGRTHPKVLLHEGDAYRHSLERRVQENDVGDMVFFDNNYRSLASLQALIASATVVILPYDSPDQATSGVLVDAIAAGRPVIATSFPHSRELLASGAGIVIGHRDARTMADAIRSLLNEPGLAVAMAHEARRIAPLLSWDGVARRYVELAGTLVSSGTWPVSA
jgi:glycosyltransferase involved in cell wall biosynthesis